MAVRRALPGVVVVLAMLAAPVACRGGANTRESPVAEPAESHVKQLIRTGLRTITAYQADVVSIVASGPDYRETILVTAAGQRLSKSQTDWRRDDQPAGRASFYSKYGGFEFAEEVTGIGPEAGRDFDPFDPDGMAKLALGLDDGTAVETTFASRRAWTLQGPLLSPYHDHAVVTIDDTTGLGLRLQLFKDAVVVQERRVETLVLDPMPKVEGFLPAVPAGVPVRTEDAGFRPVTRAELARSVAYRPVLPARVPDGFTLTELAVAEFIESLGDNPNPSSRHVVAMRYRRGLESFTVSTRLRGTGAEADQWRSPHALSDSAPGVHNPEKVRLVGGAFDGRDAEVSSRVTMHPSLWALSAELVLTIDGGLEPDELIAVAQSLDPCLSVCAEISASRPPCGP